MSRDEVSLFPLPDEKRLTILIKREQNNSIHNLAQLLEFNKKI